MLPLFDELTGRCSAAWEAAQAHPFVGALADGSLPRERFTYFLAQDYVYLMGYSRALALAAAKAPNLPRLNAFTELLHSTLRVEMQLHRDYCGQFGLLHGELDDTVAAPACRAYIDFGIAAASLGDSLDLLCALAPCAVGYGQIGQRIVEELRAAGEPQQAHPYRLWIETYGGEEYQTYARWVVEAINDLGAGIASWRVDHLAGLMLSGCRWEWFFWDMAWKMEKWPI
jgi:thiaminase/transcriptional activator TenA